MNLHVITKKLKMTADMRYDSAWDENEINETDGLIAGSDSSAKFNDAGSND